MGFCFIFISAPTASILAKANNLPQMIKNCCQKSRWSQPPPTSQPQHYIILVDQNTDYRLRYCFGKTCKDWTLIIQPTAYNNSVGFFGSNGKTPHSIATIIGKPKRVSTYSSAHAYIADYLAKTTGQAIVWYDYDRCQRNWHGKISTPSSRSYLPILCVTHRAHRAQSSLPTTLKLLPDLLQGKDVLPQFITQMTQTLYQQSQSQFIAIAWGGVRLFGKSENRQTTGCRHRIFLPIWQRWILIIAVIVWCKIDEALSAIQQAFGLRKQIIWFLQDASHQAFCYLLGFILAWPAVAGKCTRAWVSFAQMYDRGGVLLNALSIVLYCCLRTAIARRCW